MATKTFEELKQLAIQIRDEKTNKQNTATRIGTQMLEHLDKLEQDYYDKTATDEELQARDEKLTELDTKTEEIYNLLSKSLYYENTLLDASNGTTSFIGKDKSFDCILIPTRGAKKAYIEGLNINSANGICFFENFPEFKGSITGGYITTSTSLPINESRIIDIPNNAKVLGFSIAISSRLDNDTRQKIKLRDLYFEDIVDTKIDTKIEESFSKNNNIQLFKNLRAISDSTKSNSKIEFLPIYFDLGDKFPNGFIGESSDWKCIIVPSIIGDTIKVPIITDIVNSCTLSSYPTSFGEVEEGIIINKNIEKKIKGSYTEYTITDNDTKYIALTIRASADLPELPLIVDSGNVTAKELGDVKSSLKEAKGSIPFINHDLGLIKDFDFGKYDDICLLMDGQSLSIGWESIAISTTPQDNCYMLGTDPCTRNTGFNGIGLNPLKSVIRESPNVSWCNVMSKLIPNKRFITSSVGEGDKRIEELSKTNDTSLIEAEFVGHGTIDPSNGAITLHANGSSYISFVLEVNPGETYYITGVSQIITEYSAKPKWNPIDNSYNKSILIGQGNNHMIDNQYTVPDGVYCIGLCQNNADYVTEKAFVIKGIANRYEKSFILPMAQLKAVEDNDDRTIGCPAIVWMQGEGDVSANKTKEYYKEMLVKLKNDMQSDIMSIFGQTEKPLFFCYMLALTGQKENNIMMAIAECCQENNDMILIAPIYAMPDYNNLHLSSNGNRWYGEYIARSTYNALILGKRDNCIVPYQFVIDSTKLKIKVNAPKLPLVIDTWTVQEVPQAGFKVWKNGSEIILSDVTLYGDEITLNCAEDISSGTIEVSYAGHNPSDSKNYRGTGNIRDSDRWQALQTYWDDTDDKGTYGTSTITYKPKTKNGESLIGKLYPMQNWLQNFYYKLS